ncbi:MAG: hypothetical protein C0412_17635 [Flavobacterium sp.]|nr:hypothetical protein [Flavobacterium sp.]
MKFERKLSNKAFSKYSEKNIHPLIRIIKSKSVWIVLGLLFGMFTLITALEVFIPHSHDHLKKRITEIISNDSIESEVRKISSKFICNCGKCSKDSLVKCKCQDAIAKRNMIRTLLAKNILPQEIIKEINNKYGGLIAE